MLVGPKTTSTMSVTAKVEIEVTHEQWMSPPWQARIVGMGIKRGKACRVLGFSRTEVVDKARQMAQAWISHLESSAMADKAFAKRLDEIRSGQTKSRVKKA